MIDEKLENEWIHRRNANQWIEMCLWIEWNSSLLTSSNMNWIKIKRWRAPFHSNAIDSMRQVNQFKAVAMNEWRYRSPTSSNNKSIQLEFKNIKSYNSIELNELKSSIKSSSTNSSHRIKLNSTNFNHKSN